MKITLTIQQRFAIETIIRMSGKGDGPARNPNLDDAEILHDIRKRVRLTADESKNCLRPLPAGGILFDEVAISKAPAFQVDLERTEALKLKSRIEDWVKECGGYADDDLDWLVPLKQELEAASKYKAAAGE